MAAKKPGYYLWTGLAVLAAVAVLGLGWLSWSSLSEDGQALVEAKRRMVLSSADVQKMERRSQAPAADPAMAEPAAPAETAPAPAAEEIPVAPAAEEGDETPAEDAPAEAPVMQEESKVEPPAGAEEADPTSTQAASRPPGATVMAQPDRPSDGVRLNPAPNKDLGEKTPAGVLPVIGPDGTRPSRYYARPAKPAPGTPVIAIVIPHLGLGRQATESAMALPGGVTLSFSPYARSLDALVARAREIGHEVLLDLSMEPKGYPVSDPGPYGLMLGLKPEENQGRLHRTLGSATGYVGLYGARDENLSSSVPLFRAMLEELGQRGIFYLHSNTLTADAYVQISAVTDETESAMIDLVIDEKIGDAAITDALQRLEDTARERGKAIGVAHAYPITLRQLEPWIASLANRNMILVPLSTAITHTVTAQR